MFSQFDFVMTDNFPLPIITNRTRSLQMSLLHVEVYWYSDVARGSIVEASCGGSVKKNLEGVSVSGTFISCNDNTVIWCLSLEE